MHQQQTGSSPRCSPQLRTHNAARLIVPLTHEQSLSPRHEPARSATRCPTPHTPAALLSILDRPTALRPLIAQLVIHTASPISTLNCKFSTSPYLTARLFTLTSMLTTRVSGPPRPSCHEHRRPIRLHPRSSTPCLGGVPHKLSIPWLLDHCMIRLPTRRPVT